MRCKMTEHKRNTLKELIKIKTLATLAGIAPNYLSNIINNKQNCSDRLAQQLALHANTLVGSEFFTAQDFLN